MSTKDMRIDHRLLGITSLLSCGPHECSGPRNEMLSSHVSQARPVIGAELPHMFTGFEALVGDYTFNSAACKNDVKVIRIINKYNLRGYNPLRTVIYRDLVTGDISYFNLRRYSSYSNDYGYENQLNYGIQDGDIIPAGTELYSSSSKDGDVYKMGVNANVAFITLPETTEDLFPISESLAKRLSPLSISTKKISVNLKKFPLNLNGNLEDFKIFPDLGETVRADGIICAWRPSTKFSMIADLQPERLTEVNHLFDQKVYGYPGATVIDVDVYIDSRANLPIQPYNQVKMYHEALLVYHQAIVDTYEKYKTLPISSKFSTLVTKAMGMLLAAKRYVPALGKNPKIQLADKLSPVGLRIDLTLAHRVVVNNGFKCTGRAGDKGVVVVLPDEQMPVDEQGFRADICIDPVSVLKRTNLIQLYEQYINRVLKWQAMHLDQFGDIEGQFSRVIEILNDINPTYADTVAKAHPTVSARADFVAECKADTIKVRIPPGYDKLTTDLIEKLENKYQTPISRVSFMTETDNGPKMITTKSPVAIGAKYIYLLAKYPKVIASGLGFVNHYHYPTGTSDKNGVPVGSTPVRFGEAESRMLATAIGTESVVRLRGLYGNTKVGPDRLVNALLNSQAPSQLVRVPVETEELADNDFAVRIAHHECSTAGIDIQHSIMTDEESVVTFKDLEQLAE